MKKVFLTTVVLLGALDACACTVCFKGDANQTANIAARAGVLLLLVVIVGVLALFAGFFFNLAKRSKQFIQDS